ncbi:MAG: DUF4959 domain-containing protein [Prevotellaceae bacterium]|jgi:hypothetical protein|nr:DUF4959 domain-containing protein [Prevotellaceae bacterium]
MKTIYYFLIVFAVMLVSCTEKTLEPLSESKGKPGGITEIETARIPGGATVNFRIPNAEDILSVKAVYTLTNGKKRESITSYYGNYVVIEGYNDTIEHEALFYTINRAQVESDPVSVKFTPLESPLSKSVNSVNIITDFGGANFSWKNEYNATLTYELMTQDNRGDMQIARIISSKLDSADYTLRGYLPSARKFGMIVRDIFGNASGMLIPPGGTLVPLLEEKLDKSKMSVVILGSDITWTNWDGRDYLMIDDNTSTFAHTYTNTMPDVSFTLDLGAKAKLSRFLIHQRSITNGNPSPYALGNPKDFEVYACYDTPSASGDWSEWTKVKDCTIVKPSGSPIGTNTDEDIIAMTNGHEFSFSSTMEPVRYLRFKIRTTWEMGTNRFCHITEITPFGRYEE